jgi:hypothetical protein
MLRNESFEIRASGDMRFAPGLQLGACLSIRRILLAKEVRVGFFVAA